MIKKALLVFAGVVVLLLIVGAVMRSKWHVEQSASVEASPAAVYAIVADLRTWRDWSAWNKQVDPGATWTYAGPPTGAGSSMTWKGEKLGQGTLSLREGDPQKGMRFDIELVGQGHAEGTFSFAADGTKTKVTWMTEGDTGSNPIGHFFVPGIEAMLDAELADGLAALSPLVVAKQAELDKAAAAAKAASDATAAVK